MDMPMNTKRARHECTVQCLLASYCAGVPAGKSSDPSPRIFWAMTWTCLMPAQGRVPTYSSHTAGSKHRA